MFLYFPVRGTDGAVCGSVRYADAKATVSLTVPADCYLFSGDRPVPVTPGLPIPCPAPDALIGVRDSAAVLFGAAPGVRKTAADYYALLSPIRTMQAKLPPEDPPESPESHADSPDPTPEMNQIHTTMTPELHTIPFVPFDTRQAFAQEEEPPMTVRARAVLAALEARDVPKTVHNVDNLVDNSAESAVESVQKRDILAEEARWRYDGAYLRDAGTDALLDWSGDGGAVGIRLFPRVFPGAEWRFVARDGTLPHFEGTWQYGSERIRILAVRGEAAPTPPPGLSGFTRYLKNDGAGYWVRLLPMGKA